MPGDGPSVVLGGDLGEDRGCRLEQVRHHAGEVQGIKVKWREVGWNALIEEFAPDSIGAELLEVEA